MSLKNKPSDGLPFFSGTNPQPSEGNTLLREVNIKAKSPKGWPIKPKDLKKHPAHFTTDAQGILQNRVNYGKTQRKPTLLNFEFGFSLWRLAVKI